MTGRRRLAVRAARFNLVGLGGFAMQMGSLWILTEHVGLHYVIAAAVALELAILHNFVWHARWTWRDRRAVPGGWWRRLGRFTLLHGTTAAFGLVIVVSLVEILRMPVMVAAMASVAICAAVNFLASDRLVFRAACALLLLAAPAFAGPDPQASAAFDRLEASIARRLGEPGAGRAPAWLERLPLPVAREIGARLRTGEVVVRPSDGDVIGGGRPCGQALCHHWGAAVHVPGVTPADVVTLLQSYETYHELYDPAVRRSRLLARQDDRFTVFVQLVTRKVVTVVLNAEYEVTYKWLTPDRVLVRSRSTRIAEVAEPGTPREREKPAGSDTGYLWRMNTECLVEGGDDGTYVYCESLALSRDLPAGLGWIVGPLVTSIPKESLAFTLGRMRTALIQQA